MSARSGKKTLIKFTRHICNICIVDKKNLGESGLPRPPQDIAVFGFKSSFAYWVVAGCNVLII